MASPVELVLRPIPQSARAAREQLEPFRERLGEIRFGDLRLLVSELIVEAIGALGGAREDPITLRTGCDGESVRVTVEGGPGTYPLASSPPQPGDAGWAVYLVQRLSDQWGVRRESDRTTVWLEIWVPADAAS